MKVLKWIDEHLEEVLLLVLLCAITLVMGVQVIARTIFNSSFTWSEEVARYLFIYMGFISVSYCIKKWISIKINQVIDLLPKKAYVIVQLILNLILFAFFIYMSYYAYLFLCSGIASGQLSPALQIPMYYVQAAPLIGFSLSSIRAFQQIVIDYKKLFVIFKGGNVC